MRQTVRSAVLLVVVVLLLSACGNPQVPATAKQRPASGRFHRRRSDRRSSDRSSFGHSASTDAAPTTAASAAASAAASTAASSAAASAELVTVKVVTLPFISFAPFYIADQEGFFAEQGIDVELVNMTQQQEIMPALASGQVDVASGLVSAGILNTIAKSGDVKVVADKGYIDPQGCDNIALVASKSLIEQGVASNPELLKGKTFVLIRSTWLDYFAQKQFAQAGLDVEEMNLTDIPSPSQPEALDKGQVDLIAQNEPWVTRFKQAGHQPILTPAHELMPDAQSAVTVFGPKLLGENADVGNRFMVAYLKAVRQYNEGKTDRNVEIMANSIQLPPSCSRKCAGRPCGPTARSTPAVSTTSSSGRSTRS